MLNGRQFCYNLTNSLKAGLCVLGCNVRDYNVVSVLWMFMKMSRSLAEHNVARYRGSIKRKICLQ